MALEESINRVVSLLSGRSLSPDQASDLAGMEAEEPGTLESAALKLFERKRDELRAIFDGESQCRKVAREIENRYGIDEGDIYQPESVGDLVALLKQARQIGVAVRAVGSARSLSDAPAPTSDTIMVSTCGLADALPVDVSVLQDSGQAEWLYRCGAGRTVAEILAELDPYPDDPARPMARTLQNMGAGQFQAVGGALCTSTHGSGITQPSFPQLVAAYRMVTFDEAGEVVVLQLEPSPDNGAISNPAAFAASQSRADIPVALVQDDAQFNAGLVSLGCLGIIYEIYLKLVPGFYLEEHRFTDWWSEVKTQLPQLLGDNDYFELLIDPVQSDNRGTPDNRVLRTQRNRVEAYRDCGERPRLMELATTEIGRITSAILLEWAIKSPPARVPRNLRTGVTSTEVECYTDKNYHVLQLNLDINSASTEPAVPVEHAAAAIDAVLAKVQANLDGMMRRFPPPYDLGLDRDTPFHEDVEALKAAWREVPIPTSPLGVRFVSANDAPLSQMYQRATCTIEMPMPGSDYLDQRTADDPASRRKLLDVYEAYLEGRQKLFTEVEQLLIDRFDARPHWEQANYLDRATTARVLPAFEDWLDIYRLRNASGLFNSAFTDRLNISVHPELSEEPAPLPDGQPVQGEAVFRHDRSENRGILKVKDELAKLLYQRLTQPVEEPRCRSLFFLSDRCKRMGVSCVASTQNLIDPYVVEFRFTPTGELLSLTQDYDLDNALALNRDYGTASFDGRLLTISGDAAAGLRDFVRAGRMVNSQPPPEPDDPVVLRLEALEKGDWDVEPF
ncbi:D-arabinono-1,4-lactone oxidase [Candidatus Entotheonella palauensis]|uniref:D-arabinono-1,4-lactone oxidase n=1 Tax=Candidatus Entotheonella palauensis TaxID=93172 RepID=UPI0015C4C3F5|nr:D-arabinono-1,4-lactone oxidase [Candidatus Entotheonella palauensis]